MLLDEVQSAYNELVVEYREAADHLTLAAERISDGEVKELFTALAEQHSFDADTLSEVVRQSGALPRAQNIDREDLHRLVTQVRAALSEDERQVVIDDRLDHERRILNCLNEAIDVESSTEGKARIEQLRERQVQVIEKLENCTGNQASR